jgi:hypothetical protein
LSLLLSLGGIPEKAIKKAFAETDIYVSPSVLKEYREVPLILEDEKKLTQAQLKALISGLAAFVTRTIIVHPGISKEYARILSDLDRVANLVRQTRRAGEIRQYSGTGPLQSAATGEMKSTPEKTS